MVPQKDDSAGRKSMQWIGFFAGPLLAWCTLFSLPTHFEVNGSPPVADSTPATAQDAASSAAVESAAEPKISKEFTWAGRATLGVMVWMGIWWLTEATHISVTALLPLVAFPLMGIERIEVASAPYANHLIFLYFGGFMLAFSMEKWGLGKRFALLTLRVVGTSTSAMMAGFMFVTAVLSAFVSNTATTAMMLPIGLSVIALLRRQTDQDDTVDDARVDRFATGLLLAIAYSASVGGVTTIIGTPTNAFLITFLKEQVAAPYQIEFSFAGWLPIGGTLAIIFLPIIYFVMTKFLFPVGTLGIQGGKKLIERELKQLGGVNRGEWNTLGVFSVVVFLWLFRPLVTQIAVPVGDWVFHPFANVNDSVIAMTGAIALFLIPVDLKQRRFTMDWETANRVPWGILLLFGGGLSLADAVKRNGVAEFIGSQAELFRSVPTIVVILAVTAAIVFLTELTSNAATTASLVPVLAALAPGMGVHPFLLVIPATVASSCAFMLPVATPPNAIVFGSGEITVPQMARAGVVLNLIAIVLVTLLAVGVVQPWLLG